MKDDFGRTVPEPPTVPATTILLDLLADSEFEVMEDFHPSFQGSLTLVHQETKSAVTIVAVESSEDDGDFS